MHACIHAHAQTCTQMFAGNKLPVHIHACAMVGNSLRQQPHLYNMNAYARLTDADHSLVAQSIKGAVNAQQHSGSASSSDEVPDISDCSAKSKTSKHPQTCKIALSGTQVADDGEGSSGGGVGAGQTQHYGTYNPQRYLASLRSVSLNSTMAPLMQCANVCLTSYQTQLPTPAVQCAIGNCCFVECQNPWM